MDLWQLKLGKQNAASDSRIKMAVVLVWWVVVVLGEVSVLAEVTEEEEMGLIDRVTGISSVTPLKLQTRFALIVPSAGRRSSEERMHLKPRQSGKPLDADLDGDKSALEETTPEEKCCVCGKTEDVKRCGKC